MAEQGAFLTFGRDICGNWPDAIGREWLVTNGLGGFACGTVAGANTRRYHGFLMASLAPSAQRTLLVAKVEVRIRYQDMWCSLAANEFADGTIDPRGFVHLESFEVVHGIPVWRHAIADALVETRIFMAPGANTSYLRLEVLRAAGPVEAEFKPLVTYRGYHAHGTGARPFHATAHADCCTVFAPDGALSYRLILRRGRYQPADTWYWGFLHRDERERGLDPIEDLWGPGTFTADVGSEPVVFFTATAETVEPPPGDAVQASLVARAAKLCATLPRTAPPWICALAEASDQFIVQRHEPAAATASVIAGYPWFADWGRDTMIALPGLTTVLGRFTTAAAILRGYAGFVDRGMLPNRFSDTGAALEYNTADATLWLFQALHEHLESTEDDALLTDLYPVLNSIIEAHVGGTRFGIQVDADDGLLRAGVTGLQLTWMDAKHDEKVFTPRIGKPVEINALWLNALHVTAGFARALGDTAREDRCQDLLRRGAQGFARFWNEPRGCLYDVLDVDGGSLPDGSVRPNQILAISLPYTALPMAQMRAVVDTCARELLTSHGLRTLSPSDPAYIGRYAGGPAERDAAYHQGTVWAWLLGPFARAHHRVYGDARRAQQFLAPMEQHLAAACVGSVSEIFDGDAPHNPAGCFAQAWSVAEILRSWIYLERRITQR